jgi:hypothetical protein
VLVVLVVLVVRQGLLGPTLFLALYLLQVVVEAVLAVVHIPDYLAALAAVQMLLVVAGLQLLLVKVLLVKAMLADCLLLLQTIQVAVAAVLGRLV